MLARLPRSYIWFCGSLDPTSRIRRLFPNRCLALSRLVVGNESWWCCRLAECLARFLARVPGKNREAIARTFGKRSRRVHRNAYGERLFEPIQGREYGFIQSCVLGPASSTIQCSVLESSWTLPACVIGLTMLGPFPLDPTFHAIKSSAHPSEPARWLDPLRLRLD